MALTIAPLSQCSHRVHVFITIVCTPVSRLQPPLGSTAPQTADIRTAAKSLPLFLKYPAKGLFLNRVCQTDEKLK